MATNSYPAVGTGGLTDAQWSAMYAGRDGVIEDYTGNSFAVTYNDASDTAHIGAGTAVVNGYVLEVDSSGEDLYLADAVGAPVVYYIGVMYDPALNIPDGGGARSALGPCRLIVNTTYSTAGGKMYTLLYKITRNPSQALSAAAIVDYRRWLGPTIEMDDYPSSTHTGFGPFPRGSTIIQRSTGDMSARTITDDGSALYWKSLFNSPVLDFPFVSPQLNAFTAGPQMLRYASVMVKLRGTLKRSSGALLSTGADVTLGTLPVGWRPYIAERFHCTIGGNQTSQVTVNSSGTVIMEDPPAPTYWIDLAAIMFRAEN